MIRLRDLLLSPLATLAQWWDRVEFAIVCNRWLCVAVYVVAFGTTLGAAVGYTA